MESMRYVRKLLVMSACAVVAALAAVPGVFGASAAKPTVVEYGATVTLSGAPAAGSTKETSEAQLLSQPCGFTGYTQVASIPLRNGKFVYNAGPTLSTTFRLVFNGEDLARTQVLVRPRVDLARSGAVFTATVTSANGTSFGGKTVLLQMSSKKTWKTVKRIRLRVTSRPDEIDSVAAGKTTARIPAGAAVRLSLPAGAAAPCYAAATTKPQR